MVLSRSRISYIFIAVFTIILLVIIYLRPKQAPQPLTGPLLSQNYTQSDDTLRVLLYAHSSDYFMFRSTPIGFQYELLNALAKGLDMKLDLTLNGNPDEVYSQAFGNRYDIVAMDFKKNHFVAQLLTLSLPHSQSHPVLIERVPEEGDSTAHRILYVPAQFSSQISTDSLPDPSSWVTAYSSELTTEEMFDLLQKKKMDYIVSDYQTAITLLPFYSDLQMSRQIGEDFDRSWVLNDYNDELNQRINSWLAEYKQSKEYEKLCKKYFSPHSKVLNYTSPQTRSKRISPYDRELKKYAKPYRIDWRLVASIIYQESKFQSNLVGMGGSFGLMQLMPATAARYGITPESSPEEQIKGGIQLIAQLKRRYRNVENDEDRLYFICAAYNAGSGHIQDAQRLCEKYGEDKYVWNNVAKYLELKSESQHYNDPVVKLGYYPGRHTVKYAERVIARYNGYKTMVK